MAVFRIYVKSSKMVDGKVGWGALIHTPDGELWERVGELPQDGTQTENRSTMQGIVAALGMVPNPAKVIIYTDMQYIADGFNNSISRWFSQGWKRKANGKRLLAHPDLWMQLYRERQRHELSFEFTQLFDYSELLSLAIAGREGEDDFLRNKAPIPSKKIEPNQHGEAVDYEVFRANLDRYLCQAAQRAVTVVSKNGALVTLSPAKAPNDKTSETVASHPAAKANAQNYAGLLPGGAPGPLPWEDA